MNVTQYIPNPDGDAYATATSFFEIEIKASKTGYCIPDFMKAPPSVYSVSKILGNDPSEFIIASKSRNNCTDTKFTISY